MSTQTWPKRRKLWHWLSDYGAPFWLWSRFVRDTWYRCSHCGIRGFGRWKGASSHGGGKPTRRYCSGDHMRSAEGMF